MSESSAGKVRPNGPVVLKAGDDVAGFTVEGLLASGAFGTVYRASRGGRPFAIKLVPMGPRGDREVDALRRAQLPNVVGFSGYCLWPDEAPRFLVLFLELVVGRTLEQWALEENPTALELVRDVLLPLADTLAEVHAAGVVHRDVKESNILVRDSDGEPVLVDFGAAGYEGATRLTAVLPPGTPEYRSPEALRFAREDEGEGPYPAGPGDDLWALGVTLYFLLTRELPFGDRLRPDLTRAILHETPPAPHELNPRVPGPLSAVCMHMLEKEPRARYANAEALAEALEEAEALADEAWRAPLFPGERKEKRLFPVPVAAPEAPESPEAPEPRPSERWPWAVGLVLALALLLGVPSADVPRTASAHHHATPRALSGQELETADVTAEVEHGAAPEQSPTPAPIARAMHNEVPLMLNFKSRKARFLAAAACVASASCVGGPKVLPPPPPADCPPGAAEEMERLDIHFGDHGVLFAPFDRPDIVPVKEGPTKARVIGTWGELPAQTFVFGRLYMGTGRVYGRFTEARLPSGEVVPVCLEMYRNMQLGVPFEDDSPPGQPMMGTSVTVVPVSRFGRRNP